MHSKTECDHPLYMVHNNDKNTEEKNISRFEDIAPYDYDEFPQRIRQLVEEPGFENAVRFIMPEVDYPSFKEILLSAKDIEYFQRTIVGGFLEYLVKKTTSGLSYSGMGNVAENTHYTFISNHRDIVLDASFLNLCFIRAEKPLTQIAIGNNLLIYQWIRDLVRINRSFIVKRDVKPLEALKTAKELSSYIHHTITERKESVWIAQREGRAKDSNDITQESLLKMLTLGSPDNAKDSLMELNILPVSISYEYDPNDYLKVKEFLLKKRDPEFKKSQHDDLFSMETGILQFKGHVHFTVNSPINRRLANCEDTDRNSVVRFAREIIDNEIHRGYEIYPINYVAFDELEGTNRFEEYYDQNQKREIKEYFSRQEALVDVDNITAEEHEFIHEMFLKMYANPLINKLEAQKLTK